MQTDDPDVRYQHRTSYYLVNRADALIGALRFFAADAGHDLNARRIQFLAQSDFWEWEIDNLIYSFTNLAERQQTWTSPRAAVTKLGRLGIVVDAKRVHMAQWRGTRWYTRTVGERVAPVDLLREAIDLWNRAVDHAERQYILPMRKPAERWNIQTRHDLDALRKRMPELSELDPPD